MPNEELAGVAVLVVEDDDDLRDLLALTLAAMGADVRDAKSGFDALERLNWFRPDVILCDLHMPEMDGCEFVSQLRTRWGVASVPVLALTGPDSPSNVFRTMEVGFDGHLPKPVTAAVLASQIRRILGGRN